VKSQHSDPEQPVRQTAATAGDKIQAALQPLREQLEVLKAYLKKHGPFWLRQIKQDLKRDSRQYVRAIKRVGKERVYRLKGYTTVAKINRKRQSERQQRFLRRVLLILFAFLLVILLANVYNPIKDFTEWYRIIGIKHLGDALTTTTTVS
jgi:hypothetical protein